MNRADRRDRTKRKFISRLKRWYRMNDIPILFESWKDFLANTKWAKLLKHGKLYGRSTMNKVEKHMFNKKIRNEKYF